MSYDYAHLFSEGRKIVTERMETIQIERSPLDQIGGAKTTDTAATTTWKSAWRPSTAPAGDLRAFAVKQPSNPATADTLAAVAFRRSEQQDEAATAASWKKALAQKYAAAMEASENSTSVTPSPAAPTPASPGAALGWGQAALAKKYTAAAASATSPASASAASGGGGATGGGGGFASLVSGAGGGMGGLMRALAAKKFARKYRKDRNITDKKQKLLDSFDFSLHERIHCGYNQLQGIVAHVKKHTTRIRHAAKRGGTSTRLPPHVVAERRRLRRMRRSRRTKCPEVDLPLSVKMHNDVHTIRGFAKAFEGHEDLLRKATASVQTRLPEHVIRERKRYARRLAKALREMGGVRSAVASGRFSSELRGIVHADSGRPVPNARNRRKPARSPNRAAGGGGGGGKKAWEMRSPASERGKPFHRYAPVKFVRGLPKSERLRRQRLKDNAANADAWPTGVAPSACVRNVARRTLANVKKHHQTLTAVFRNMDQNGDGSVSLGELKEGFARVAHVELTDAEARELFAFFDADGSGEVDLSDVLPVFRRLQRDFKRAARPQTAPGRVRDSADDADPVVAGLKRRLRALEEEEAALHALALGPPVSRDGAMLLRVVFDAIDADGSGTLEKREIVRALSTDPRVKADLLAVSHGALAPLTRPRTSKRMFRELDGDADGKISFDEFKAFCTRVVADKQAKQAKKKKGGVGGAPPASPTTPAAASVVATPMATPAATAGAPATPTTAGAGFQPRRQARSAERFRRMVGGASADHDDGGGDGVLRPPAARGVGATAPPVRYPTLLEESLAVALTQALAGRGDEAAPAGPAAFPPLEWENAEEAEAAVTAEMPPGAAALVDHIATVYSERASAAAAAGTFQGQ